MRNNIHLISFQTLQHYVRCDRFIWSAAAVMAACVFLLIRHLIDVRLKLARTNSIKKAAHVTGKEMQFRASAVQHAACINHPRRVNERRRLRINKYKLNGS